MPPKTRADVKKADLDRLQALLVELLREEENKYCADCEAKQPRWASWNLGVFLCIRCAGIHRNLGVHISKVKSVTLDSWTPIQVQSMRVMGNAKAKLAYEADLPDHFRRPTSDQALEAFIRAKYEHKRYLAKNWTPPTVDISELSKVVIGGHHERNVPKLSMGPVPSKNAPSPSHTTMELLDFSGPTTQPAKTTQPTPSLLDFGDPVAAPVADLDDLFGPIVSAPPAQQPKAPLATLATTPPATTTTAPTSSSDLLHALGSLSMSTSSTPKSNSDIMSLFSSAPAAQRPAPHQYQTPEQWPSDKNNMGMNFPAGNQAGQPNYFAANQFAPMPYQSSTPQTNGNVLSGLNTPSFPSADTAAAFAAASPFGAQFPQHPGGFAAFGGPNTSQPTPVSAQQTAFNLDHFL